jgi:hypothetical protein
VAFNRAILYFIKIMIELLANIGRWGWFVYATLLALLMIGPTGQLLLAVFMVGYIGGWIWWIVITVTLSFYIRIFFK